MATGAAEYGTWGSCQDHAGSMSNRAVAQGDFKAFQRDSWSPGTNTVNALRHAEVINNQRIIVLWVFFFPVEMRVWCWTQPWPPTRSDGVGPSDFWHLTCNQKTQMQGGGGAGERSESPQPPPPSLPPQGRTLERVLLDDRHVPSRASEGKQKTQKGKHRK